MKSLCNGHCLNTYIYQNTLESLFKVQLLQKRNITIHRILIYQINLKLSFNLFISCIKKKIELQNNKI